jgi:hypothetical protein
METTRAAHEAALKAVRKSMDTGARPPPRMPVGDGHRCPATGLIRCEGLWLSQPEYAERTGIDG